MLGKRPIQKWSGELAFSTERDFERKVLPFLRVFWPALVQVPARREWDAKGIDLAVWADQAPLPVAVQCKGFAVQEVGPDQLRQTLSSIEAFARSGISCQMYLMVHNRDGRNREFAQAIQERLTDLVATGRVARAELWDRQLLLANAFDRVKQTLAEALREYTQELLRQFEERFNFGRAWVDTVPLVEDRLVFRRDEPCSIEPVQACSPSNTSSLLGSRDDMRWTLLTGPFGSGKTTTVLHAARSGDQAVLVVPARQLAYSELRRSANLFLEQIANAINVFGDYEPQDRSVLGELAGPAFHDLMQQSDSPFVFVLDGLDENRAYASFEGLQTLSNQLSSFGCPVILTTRQEHLHSMFGSFSTAFYEFATKHRPQRDARLLTLAPWTTREVLNLLSQLPREGVSAGRLDRFVRLVATGEVKEWYGELPFRPLFLQFIIEDVLAADVRRVNRSSLLLSWFRRKVRRDVAARGMMLDISDIEDFCDRMVLLTEDVAGTMVDLKSGAVELTEETTSSLLTTLARRRFESKGDVIVPVLLNSVLVPQGLRRGSQFKIEFAFKVFQEYFLARYVARSAPSIGVLPANVQSFLAELREGVQG
jgi:hypothetical protein